MHIVLRRIVKRFGAVTANHGLTLALAPGRIYGLLGENGAGKSTLMRIVSGQLWPDEGTIAVNGRDVPGLTPGEAAELGIGMLSQDPLDFPALTVWENFALGGRVLSRRQAKARLADLAARFGFDLPPEAPVARLTVAERQQLELLRLIDRDVRALILDEPTTGLAPAHKAALFALLKDFAAAKDRLVVLVTHKLAEARELCQKVFVLRKGGLAGSFEAPLDKDAILYAMFGEAGVAAPPPSPTPSPVTGAAPVLALDQAAFADGAATMAGLTLAIRPGEIVGLAGVAGGGAEMFLRGLAGLIPATAGSLRAAGGSLRGKPLSRFQAAGIRYLPAARLEEGLFPGLSLIDHVILAFPGCRREAAPFFRQRCVAAFRLPDTPDATVETLSGGNQQRLLLALLPDDARLVLADNPTRGLDVASVSLVWEHLSRRAGAGAAVVFSSEDLDEVVSRSTRVLAFYNRRLVADLPAAQASPGLLGDLMTGRTRGAA